MSSLPRSPRSPRSPGWPRCVLAGTLLALGCYRDARDPFAARRAPPLHPSSLHAKTVPLCSLVGPGTGSPGVYGTDLGYTVAAPGSGAITMLFGDTWARPSPGCHHPVAPSDDLQGALPIRRPSFPSRAPGKKGCGLLQYSLSDPEDVTSWPKIRLFESGEKARAGRALPTGLLRTPVAAFGDGERTYGIFYRGDPTRCRSTGDCPGGMACSAEAGARGRDIAECTQGASPFDAAPVSCLKDDDCPSGESCEPLEGGVCLSLAPFTFPTSGAAPGWYAADPRRAISRTMLVGAATSKKHSSDYVVVDRLQTNRFQNVVARTVRHFDPAAPAENDYRPGHHTVLLFGRPAFVEQGGAQSLPFLLFAPLDDLRKEGKLRPRFFAGYGGDGSPVWSPRESDAVPIYGTGTKEAPSPGHPIRWDEPEFDYVGQMSVSYVEPLGRWVMLYGGDAPAFLVTPPRGGDAVQPRHLQPSAGAIHLRAALHPWGRSTRDAPEREAWSSAEPVLTRAQAAGYLACGEGGDEELPGCVKAPDPDGPLQMAAGLGRLAGDPGTQSVLGTAARCFVGEAVMSVQTELSGNPIGRMYAPNVIEEWTEDVGRRDGDRAAAIYWNVSTWSPYQVILVRTELRGRARTAD